MDRFVLERIEGADIYDGDLDICVEFVENYLGHTPEKIEVLVSGEKFENCETLELDWSMTFVEWTYKDAKPDCFNDKAEKYIKKYRDTDIIFWSIKDLVE